MAHPHSVMISNIVYISAAKRDFSKPELEALLEKARARNRVQGITGVLMYHDRQFFQVIEGPKDKVDRCFAEICKDDRHRSIITLQAEASAVRHFDDWYMGLVEFDDLSETLQDEVVNLCKLQKHKTFEELQSDPVIAVFANTFIHQVVNQNS